MVSVKFGKICNIGGMNVGMAVLCRLQVLPKINRVNCKNIEQSA